MNRSLAFILSIVVIVSGCTLECGDPMYPNPNENTEYELANVRFLCELDEVQNRTGPREWMPEGDTSCFSVSIYYQPHVTACNFNPHKEKTYCWIEQASEKKLRISKSLNQTEGNYVILKASSDVGRHFEDEWYAMTGLSLEGERGDCEFYLRFYIPSKGLYLTTRRLRVKTLFDYYYTYPDSLEDYGRYMDKIIVEYVDE